MRITLLACLSALLGASTALAGTWTTGQIDLHTFTGDTETFTTDPVDSHPLADATLTIQHGMWNGGNMV